MHTVPGLQVSQLFGPFFFIGHSPFIQLFSTEVVSAMSRQIGMCAVCIDNACHDALISTDWMKSFSLFEIERRDGSGSTLAFCFVCC